VGEALRNLPYRPRETARVPAGDDHGRLLAERLPHDANTPLARLQSTCLEFLVFDQAVHKRLLRANQNERRFLLRLCHGVGRGGNGNRDAG
jgi:hypothetical protein